MYPRQSATVYAERLGDEVSLYDWSLGRVHALNPISARVWQQCDGATSAQAIADSLRRDLPVPDAEAIVDLALHQLARAHLLATPETTSNRPALTRRDLLRRGATAALLPAIYSIVAPEPVAAQSGPALSPTLSSINPAFGNPGTTAMVTLTGTNFIVGGTTVTVSGTGVTVDARTASSTTTIALIAIDEAAPLGTRMVTVTTAGGTSGPVTFTIVVTTGAAVFIAPGTHTFTVRPAVTTLRVTAAGAQGGNTGGATGGLGGTVRANLAVSPHAVLTIVVGGQGGGGSAAASGAGGLNGGGAAGTGVLASGGGGASDIRLGGTALTNRVIVAGGGGGAGLVLGANGGAGGGTTGAAGGGPTGVPTGGGGGGTQAAGGSGGTGLGGAVAGLPGSSGTGGAGGSTVSSLAAGGGGGGGFFGGGGGTADAVGATGGGGGGGGSSFADPAITFGVMHTQGDRTGNGGVGLEW